MRSFQDLVDLVGRIAGSEEPFDDSVDDLLSDKAIEERKRQVIAAGSQLFYDTISKGENLPTVLCRLHQDPGDPDAWRRLEKRVLEKLTPENSEDPEDPEGSESPGFPSSFPFTLNVLTRIYYQFLLGAQDSTIPDRISLSKALQEVVTSYSEYLPTCGTENTAAMKRTAGYLFGKAFPDSKFLMPVGCEASLVEECENFMYRYGQKLFTSGMYEYLSPTYDGVNTGAWLTLVDFARDEEVRDMASAILDWMLADYALNYHHGLLLPPLERYTGLLTTNKYLRVADDEYIGYLNDIQRSFAYTRAQWTGWLYWGGGNTPREENALQNPPYALQIPHGMDAIRHAVSGYIPDRIIRNIGAKRVKMPYMVWQSHGNSACLRKAQSCRCSDPAPCQCKQTADCEKRYRMRSAYVARDFSIGVLYRRKDLGDPLNRLGGPLVSVAWESTDALNWLLVVHPYWYTLRNRRLNKPDGKEIGPPLESYDWVGASPFGQAVHWENACVAVFDIPPDDPYSYSDINVGSTGYESERVAQPIRAVYVYFPDTMSFSDTPATTSAIGQNLFLMRSRGGSPRHSDSREVYIAVRPFCVKESVPACVEEGGHEGFQRLAIPGSLVGLAMEVGSVREYGSFDEFRRRISGASLDLTSFKLQKQVTYESTRGHVLRIQYNPSAHNTDDCDPDDWLPAASVNGTALEFDNWPVYQSPYVTWRDRDRVLDVNDGRNGFRITWDERVPRRETYRVQSPASGATSDPVVTRSSGDTSS